jgi:polyisoprenyl-teichoic acid--peptidoglycan teichoic acid transferase
MMTFNTKFGFFIVSVLLLAGLFGLTGVDYALAQDVETDEDHIPAWDGQSRFTMLILGMDRRPGARDTLQVRTDTIILASLDPATQSIGLLHIPRDLHLTPPGSDQFVRANTLMLEGEHLQEGYGPYYAMDAVQYNLGIYIDRYVLFDFEAFIELIDALGGVEITITYNISDPTYPDMHFGFDPFFLSAGRHRLDGETALKFARTRHGDNDYMRGVRQMQLLGAIHEQVARSDSLPRLMMQAPQLMQELRHNVYTDLAVQDIIYLAQYASAIPPEHVVTGAINQEHIILYALPGGTRAYIPDRTKLADLMTSVFGENYFQ